MQVEPAERRKRQAGRGRRAEGLQGRSELQGNKRAVRSTDEELARFKETFGIMQKLKEISTGERGRDAEKVDRDEEEGQGLRDRSRGAGERRQKEVRSRRATSEGGEGGEQPERLRRRINQLEKEKLELTSSHNQELCRLQTELTRLRSAVERGEAQRSELQYQLTVAQRDADRATELSRDKHKLTERAAELQLKVQELQKALEITRQARDEDQHALQQEVEERDRLIQSFSSENQRLHRLLQDQEEAMEESERGIMELQKEREKEAEGNRRQTQELRFLTEREERSRREKERSDQKVKSLESNIEAERAAHLESKFNSEVVQLRLRDVEAALAAERSVQQEARSSLELLRAQFREVERAYSAERERSSSTERALERLQQEFDQYKSELNAALEKERRTTSDLTGSLEEEKKQHNNTHTLLEQAVQRRSDTEEAFKNFMKHIREALQQHNRAGSGPPAKHDGNLSPAADVLQILETTLSACQHKLETTEKQVQDLLSASEKLKEENEALRQQMSHQGRQMEESQQKSVKLEEEVTRFLQEVSDWSTQSRGLKAELERERGERERDREREKERRLEVQKILDHQQEESKARLSFLYRLYQRLLAGCVLLDQPHCILGDFTWKELCDVITEQVDQLTSDLQAANEQIARLQSVCEKKSVCVRELQRSQECVLSRLEETVRRREEAWSSRHTHTVTRMQSELQVCRSQCDSLRDHASSLELRLSSVTSDLSSVTTDLSSVTSDLSRSREESASLLAVCALLAGALRHTHGRLLTLCAQKTVVSRRLQEREELEEEVRRLAAALGGEDEDKDKEQRKRRAVRRWRRSVYVLMAVRRWQALANQTTVLLRVERGGGASVCVCGETTMGTRRDQDKERMDKGDDDEGVCTRWLRCKSLSSFILSSMVDLQGVLTHTGSSPLDVTSAARSALSRLLDHILGQSDVPSSLSPCSLEKQMQKVTPSQSNMKALISSLQQHFLLFTQRLHSAEVERRSLRLEVRSLKRGLRREREGTEKTVPAERFHTICSELSQALSREQEAQTLLQQQTDKLNALQLRVNTHTEQISNTHTLTEITQSLSDTRHEVTRKDRSLRILGKHLSAFHKEKKQLEEKLRRVEEELRDTTRRSGRQISDLKTAETSHKEVTEFPEKPPLTDLETPRRLPLSDLSIKLPVSLSPALSQANPAPSSPLSKTSRAKQKEKKNTKKNRREKK